MVAQIVAVVIFIAMFALIVSEKIERHLASLGCGLLMLILVFGFCMHSGSAVIDTLNVGSIFTPGFWYSAGEASESSAGINWETIFFIAGMMVMVEGMGRAGFFRWLCLCIARLVKYKAVRIFVTFMMMSFVLAMFIDSITVILFLAAVTVELARLLEFNPVPVILAEVFCANLGGSATMCGDPPNIIIGTSLGYTFGDFVTNTGLIALICLVFVIIYFYICFHKELSGGQAAVQAASLNPKDAIENKKDFTISCIIFAVTVVLLVTHAQTGLTVSTIGTVIGIVTLIAAGRDAIVLIKKVDYKTLLFFIGLFVVVGGLEQTGILEVIAGFIADISEGNAMLMIAIVLWISAIASAFVDNIPFAATMIPIIKSLAASQGVALPVLAWTLAIGTDIGGSATPIGASANVVGISVAAKNGHMIGWGKYCRYMAPATILVVLISMACIYLRYF
ncbi:MAG: SLC13 family permease [Marvinbryantia sp.]|uniref:SLC13 family permease n=1 Tax=Marvinbryantia sp. TaxID=2496532 RepID=UPI00262F21FF|nr:SLC13 family permease [uncultured Marvinbryantia sp.]